MYWCMIFKYSIASTVQSNMNAETSESYESATFNGSTCSAAAHEKSEIKNTSKFSTCTVVATPETRRQTKKLPISSKWLIRHVQYSPRTYFFNESMH